MLPIFKRRSRAGGWLAAGLALLAAGCSTPKTASQIANAGGLAMVKPSGNGLKLPTVAVTSVVGSVEWSNGGESIGALKLTGAALPPNTTVIARDAAGDATSVMQNTGMVRGNYQGLFLVRGVPTTDDEVVLPGPEYTQTLQANLPVVVPTKQDKQAFRSAGTADPTVIP